MTHSHVRLSESQQALEIKKISISNMSNKDLKNTTDNDVAAFLKKVASTPVVKKASTRSRLLFGMDATASRAHLWDQAMHIQNEMFAETAKLGGLAIQLAYYQGYGEFYTTPWHTQAHELLQEMRNVQCVSGITQIEKILKQALRETKSHKLKALVFVGDCFEEDRRQVEQLAGQLGLLGVPAFMFQEGNEPIAEDVFRTVASITRGAYCRFDASSAHQLKDLLQAVAIYAAGGRQALEQHKREKPSSLVSHIHGQLPKL